MAKREPPSEDEMLRAFRACPVLDRETAVQHCPEVVEVSEMLAKCLAVHWEWVLLALLACVGVLIPEDRFETAPSIEVQSSLWIILIHPGATNSSGVISLVTKAMTKLVNRLHKYETDSYDAHYNALSAEERGEYDPPPRRQVLAGGASLPANGMIMSCHQNRGAALAAECEVEGVFSWFQNEMGVDKAVPGKLWDGNAWHRPVMDKARAFSVDAPWFGFIAGAHIPETFKATINDAFGLRERLTASFAEPQWLTIRQIREACAQLPARSRKPADFVAGLLLPLFKWSVSRKGEFFKASTEGGASELVDNKFDGHMDLQRQCFLQPGRHQESKYRGKLRAKFDRMALSMHALHVVCQRFRESTAPAQYRLDDNWAHNFSVPPVVSKKAVAMAYLLAEKCEHTWEILDFARNGHGIPQEVGSRASQATQPGEAPSGPPAPPAPAPVDTQAAADADVIVLTETVAGKMAGKWSWTKEELNKVMSMGTEVFKATLDKFPLYGCSLPALVDVMHVILAEPGQYFYYGKSATVARHVKAVTKDTSFYEHTILLLFIAAKVLQALGLGVTVTTRKTTRPDLVAVLAELGISEETTPTLAAYVASIDAEEHPPPRAPVVDWGQRPPASEVDVGHLAGKLCLVSAREEAPVDGAAAPAVEHAALAPAAAGGLDLEGIAEGAEDDARARAPP
ncbi:unnamed protein product [Prorocentrum cordatum]|uniref:DUF3987 domain-containing protein n=1 Tax=Prorocentrum cordatum TaxID=2364126 RepID=A0ABN9SL67_9DINO|nr:unnamed protein product [Polarella glacialis]